MGKVVDKKGKAHNLNITAFKTPFDPARWADACAATQCQVTPETLVNDYGMSKGFKLASIIDLTTE